MTRTARGHLGQATIPVSTRPRPHFTAARWCMSPSAPASAWRWVGCRDWGSWRAGSIRPSRRDRSMMWTSLSCHLGPRPRTIGCGWSGRAFGTGPQAESTSCGLASLRKAPLSARRGQLRRGGPPRNAPADRPLGAARRTHPLLLADARPARISRRRAAAAIPGKRAFALKRRTASSNQGQAGRNPPRHAHPDHQRRRHQRAGT